MLLAICEIAVSGASLRLVGGAVLVGLGVMLSIVATDRRRLVLPSIAAMTAAIGGIFIGNALLAQSLDSAL